MQHSLTVDSIFSTEALDLLRIRLQDSDHPDTFLGRVDEMADQARYLIALPQSIEFLEPLESGKNSKEASSLDGKNAVALYEAIGAIDRSNASDPRLWTYLSMVFLREYMLIRWPISDPEKFKDRVQDHWLMTSSSARKLMRNGAARLWWTAHLTHDPYLERKLTSETGDPFAYTKWVLENENRRQSIFERRIGRSPRLRWAIMETMEELQRDRGESSMSSKAMLRKLFLHTGYQRLEALPEDELKTVVKNLMAEL